MIGGLIAGALSGGGQAVQQNAQNTLETRRQEALKRLDNDLALGRMEVEAERGAAATAAEWRREDQIRQEEQAHDIKLAEMDNRGGSSYKPPSRIQEADLLVERGVYDNFDDAYEAVRSRAGQINPQEQARDQLEYYSGRLGDVNEALNDRAVVNRMSEDEVEALKAQREEIQAMIPDLERRAFGNSGLLNTPPPSPTPEPEPNPAPTNSGGGNQAPREQGQRPGPPSNQSGDPEDRANDIMNNIFN